jgi:hypothetical protein
MKKYTWVDLLPSPTIAKHFSPQFVELIEKIEAVHKINSVEFEPHLRAEQMWNFIKEAYELGVITEEQMKHMLLESTVVMATLNGASPQEIIEIVKKVVEELGGGIVIKAMTQDSNGQIEEIYSSDEDSPNNLNLTQPIFEGYPDMVVPNIIGWPVIKLNQVNLEQSLGRNLSELVNSINARNVAEAGEINPSDITDTCDEPACKVHRPGGILDMVSGITGLSRKEIMEAVKGQVKKANEKKRKALPGGKQSASSSVRNAVDSYIKEKKKKSASSPNYSNDFNWEIIDD